MLRALSVKPAGDWTGEMVDTVVLDFDDRHRRRMMMTGVRGLVFLLDLPHAVMLRHGDALVLDSGSLVEVVAAPEPLAEVRCADATRLARAAWHLGNRHLPVQILTNRLRLRRDYVIEAMLRGLELDVQAVEAPFDPEGGAYAGSGEAGAVHRSHRRDHPHGHSHDHVPGHLDSSRDHDPAEPPAERVHVDAHPHRRALGAVGDAPDHPHPHNRQHKR